MAPAGDPLGLARADQSSNNKHGGITVFLAEEAPCRLDLELCDQLFKEGAAGQGGGLRRGRT